MGSLTDEIACEPVAKRMGAGPFGDLLLGNLGHMQEHLAQMNLFLSQQGVERRAGAAGLNRLPKGVKGCDDAGVTEFVESLGGYDHVIENFFKTWLPRLAPTSPTVVHFEVALALPKVKPSDSQRASAIGYPEQHRADRHLHRLRRHLLGS